MAKYIPARYLGYDFIEECKKTNPRSINVYAYISSLNKEVRFNFNKELLKEIFKDIND